MLTLGGPRRRQVGHEPVQGRPPAPTHRRHPPGPESPHLLAARITAELHFGPEQSNRLDESLTAAGVRHHSETCTAAHRGFAQAGTAACDSTVDKRHRTALTVSPDRALRPARVQIAPSVPRAYGRQGHGRRTQLLRAAREPEAVERPDRNARLRGVRDVG
ncbi:hypothetical protein [Streptomyces sp. NBC_00154]|uniref:hypothetical protein n=1 Tax=Streptomyces sp. NBC_00154 TaxID=2975670 RepID=UPI002257B709|nr:hypothetical protein [Streptomyces sp. NBC_00154]MCX5315324.1 hypothetical protein [Streptomyces sp. NBC_00154]